MNVTFDGENKLILLGEGLSVIDVSELYSDWKLWFLQDDNAKYQQCFRNVGGDPLDETTKIAPYYFLMNDWKIRPYEENSNLIVNGNLLSEDGSYPIVGTIGNYQINVRMVTSSISTITTVETNNSALTQEEHDKLLAIPETTLTTQEHDELMGLISAMGNMIVEGELTFIQTLRLIISVLGGRTTGVKTDTIRFRDLFNMKDRVVATTDNNRNRVLVALDLD